MADAKVAVERDTCQEEDAAVQVEVEEEPNQTTHGVSKQPAVTGDVTGNKEGQGQTVHEVTECQVEHVDQRWVPRSA